MMCKNDLSCGICFRIYFWDTLRHIVDIGEFYTRVHGLIGKKGKNQLIPDINTSLHNFFHKTNEFLDLCATQVVQYNLDAVLTHVDDEDVVGIPTFCKNRYMHETFCSNIGWYVTSDASWFTFRRFWKRN